MGSIHECDGQPAVGVAKRIGGHWVPVGTMETDDPVVFIGELVKYQGTLVATGSISMVGGGGDDIVSLNGTEWQILGPGIQGGMDGAGPMAVYQGDLYVGGQFSTASGNAGQSIMRWDGTQFHAVGDGIRYTLGATQPVGTVTTMVVHEGLLFVGGGFRFAGGVEANSLAFWDGSQWCGVPGNLNPGFFSMDFYQDTLFVACPNVIHAGTFNGAAKFVGPTYYGACSSPIGVGEFDASHTPFTLSPNPASSSLSITYPGNAASNLVVTDVLGRTVLSGAFARNRAIDVGILAPGTYTLRLFNLLGTVIATGRFVRE